MVYYKENAWEDKANLKNKAILHTELMQTTYKDEIKNSIEKTKIYNSRSGFKKSDKPEKLDNARLSFENIDSVGAVFRSNREFRTVTGNEKIAVLNFASYKNPGGRFIDGSKAQEEMLCHDSFLYNVLRAFQGEYDENKKHLNKGLYENWALYSPDVVFEENTNSFSKIAKRTTTKADVITCPAPNKSLIRYGNFTEEENTRCLLNRAKFIKKVAEENNVDVLILGAWGCGVFKQEASQVAEIFKEVFSEPTTIKNVIFAVPGGNENAKVFLETFG